MELTKTPKAHFWIFCFVRKTENNFVLSVFFLFEFIRNLINQIKKFYGPRYNLIASFEASLKKIYNNYQKQKGTYINAAYNILLLINEYSFSYWLSTYFRNVHIDENIVIIKKFDLKKIFNKEEFERKIIGNLDEGIIEFHSTLWNNNTSMHVKIKNKPIYPFNSNSQICIELLNYYNHISSGNKMFKLIKGCQINLKKAEWNTLLWYFELNTYFKYADPVEINFLEWKPYKSNYCNLNAIDKKFQSFFYIISLKRT